MMPVVYRASYHSRCALSEDGTRPHTTSHDPETAMPQEMTCTRTKQVQECRTTVPFEKRAATLCAVVVMIVLSLVDLQCGHTLVLANVGWRNPS